MPVLGLWGADGGASGSGRSALDPVIEPESIVEVRIDGNFASSPPPLRAALTVFVRYGRPSLDQAR